MIFVTGTGDEIEHSELPALEQLVVMGYEYKSKNDLNKERKKTTEVLLYDRLREAIRRINPDIDSDGVDDAINQIKEDSFPFTYATYPKTRQYIQLILKPYNTSKMMQC